MKTTKKTNTTADALDGIDMSVIVNNRADLGIDFVELIAWWKGREGEFIHVISYNDSQQKAQMYAVKIDTIQLKHLTEFDKNRTVQILNDDYIEEVSDVYVYPCSLLEFSDMCLFVFGPQGDISLVRAFDSKEVPYREDFAINSPFGHQLGINSVLRQLIGDVK